MLAAGLGWAAYLLARRFFLLDEGGLTVDEFDLFVDLAQFSRGKLDGFLEDG